MRASSRLLTATLATLAAAQFASPAAAQAPRSGEGMALGLVHVDLMDLHAERLPGGGARSRELLPAADLADRYVQARAAGAAWNRWSLYWDLVERPDGSLDWSVADGIVSRDLDAGLASLLILQGTPSSQAGQAALGVCSAPSAGDAAQTGGGMAAAARRPARPAGACRIEAAPPRNLEAPTFLDAAGRTTEDPARAARPNPSNPWAVFVAAAVDRYRPGGVLSLARGAPSAGVRAWEVGNEPNLVHFWSGSADQFARYQEVAWRVIRWRDPAATVLHGGIADDAGAAAWYRAFLASVKARLAAAGLAPEAHLPFDAAGWHWYVYPSLLQTGPARARQLLAEAGLPPRPVWVTELGVPIWNEHPGPCWDAVSPWRATAEEQAGYLWQAYAEALAADVAAVFFFQLYDDCGNGPGSYDAFGLVRNHAANQCWTPPEGQACWRRDFALDGRPRPGFHALAAWSAELAGAGLLWRPPREDNFTQRVLFYRPPDRRVSLLWNLVRAEQTIAFFATGPAGTLLRLGPGGLVESEAVAPIGGRYSVALPGATNRNNPGNQAAVMAGLPRILVERDTAAPFRALVNPLPAVSSPRLELVVSAADGGTGVGRVAVLVATGDCAAPVAWSTLRELAWTADPLAGELRLVYEGLPGPVCFAARAADRAGNWTAAPSTAQASTVIGGGVATPTPGGGSPPTARPSATDAPTMTPSPSTEPTSAITPSPGPTATQTPPVSPSAGPVDTPTARPAATATRSGPWIGVHLPWLAGGDGPPAGRSPRGR